MKKIFFGALALLALSSCKKDYTCECVLDGSATTSETYLFKNVTEKDAVSKCDNYDEVYDVLGLTVVKDCEIK